MSAVVEKANRILTIIPLVKTNPGIKVSELANRLGVPERTVLRDLRTLLLCGVPPYYPNDYVGVYIDNGSVRLDFADHFKRPVSFTGNEALALRLALQNMPTIAGRHAEELKEKLEAVMTSNVSEEVDRKIKVMTGAPSLRDRIEDLERAVNERLEADIEYYTAARDAMSERTVRPYAIVEHGGHWYLVAFCLKRGKEVRFRIDRIKSVNVTDRRFEWPKDFDIARYRRPDMFFSPDEQQCAEIRLKPQLARMLMPGGDKPKLDGAPTVIESRQEPDGSLIVKLPAAGTEWLVSWAMQYGDLIEILSPPQQRRRMKDVCGELMRMYE